MVTYGELRKYLSEMLHDLASHRKSKIEEGHLMGDHIHMCISIPPKYAVSKVIGYIKRKSAIMIARQFGGKTKNFKGEKFGAREYFASTVGLDEQMVRNILELKMKEISVSIRWACCFSDSHFAPLRGSPV